MKRDDLGLEPVIRLEQNWDGKDDPMAPAHHRMTLAGIRPGQAITLDQHRALTANMDRPLTQSPVMRHRKSDQHTEIGGML